MSRVTVAILFVFTCICGCVISVPGNEAKPRGDSRFFSPLEAYQTKGYTHTGWIHKGCEEFRDPEEIVRRGPVTRIEVAHNGLIYGIRLYYGRNGQGLLHIGPRENELPGLDGWTVPEGETIVRIEGEISGHYISRLRFFTDKDNASQQFGKRPGRRFVVNEPDSGGLRTISGHVNKRRHSAKSINRAVTSMTFHFDPPCYIKDIKYDLAALEAARLKAAPEGLAHQEIPNRTSVEQSVVYQDTKTITTAKSLTFQQAFGLKMGSEISAGCPGLGSAKVNFELSASSEFGKSYVNTNTQEVSWSVPVRVPPGKKILVASTVKRYQATVPFTYKVAWYWGTRDNIVKEITLPGVYEGVHVEDLKHDFREVSLE